MGPTTDKSLIERHINSLSDQSIKETGVSAASPEKQKIPLIAGPLRRTGSGRRSKRGLREVCYYLRAYPGHEWGRKSCPKRNAAIRNLHTARKAKILRGKLIKRPWVEPESLTIDYNYRNARKGP